MSYISLCAKLNIPPSGKRMCRIVSNKHKTIADCEETTFGGTLFLSKEQYEKAMALSRKMRHMSAW